MKGLGKNKDIEFDFFSENKKDFERKITVRSILVQGQHWTKIPMVTVIITTYKRPKLLKQALESALKQVDFDNYQILVVDNEGVSIDNETETSKLIAEYSDSKIIYYRHESSVDFKMDYAVRLARSPWICFLHDDDLLSENHLCVMTRIVQKYSKIKFLSCPSDLFYNEISDEQFIKLIHKHKASYNLVKYPGHYTCTGYYTGWLGALINRQCYIKTGGMPTISNGIGDYCMVGKFANRYGVYQCISSNPLYFHRGWSGQETSKGTALWTQLYANEYKYHRYVTRKYHKFFVEFWDRISAYRIIGKCRTYNNSYYAGHIDIEKVIKESGMPKDILCKGKRYERDMLWLSIYEYLVTGKGNSEWRELSEKHLYLFLLMNKWVEILQEGKSISNYLEERCIMNVAIYGMNYVGKTLFRELQKSKIKVKYAIDRNQNNMLLGCRVVSPDADLEKVDAIIVTPVFYFEEIKNDLLKKIDCPIISLNQIINELLH